MWCIFGCVVQYFTRFSLCMARNCGHLGEKLNFIVYNLVPIITMALYYSLINYLNTNFTFSGQTRKLDIPQSYVLSIVFYYTSYDFPQPYWHVWSSQTIFIWYIHIYYNSNRSEWINSNFCFQSWIRGTSVSTTFRHWQNLVWFWTFISYNLISCYIATITCSHVRQQTI